MKRELLELLRCPEGCQLELLEPSEAGGEILSGRLCCRKCRTEYPIRDAIPRFVRGTSYADSFGFEWNRFAGTQLDSHTGLPLSAGRLEVSLGCPLRDLAGKRVLDAGCGAGRFAEAALAAGAEVVALDYSSAVDACFMNVGRHPHCHVVQGDIYRMPFQPGSFDIVYCLGVLQHTPDVHGAFLSLLPQVRPEGILAIDIYAQLFLNRMWPKYWIRPLTKRLPDPVLFRVVQAMVKYLLPVSLLLGRVPYVGRKLRYAIPVSNHEPDWPLSLEQVHEWALLDTFDMLAPEHDHPQSAETLRRWFEGAGLREISIFRHGFNIGRGRKAAFSQN